MLDSAATVVTQMKPTSCVVCGVYFMVPDHWLNERRISGAGFFCPNGHNLNYGKGENERLRQELSQEKVRRFEAEAKAGQEKVKREKLERRLRAGVCPYCKRTFQQVARHIACKHKAK